MATRQHSLPNYNLEDAKKYLKNCFYYQVIYRNILAYGDNTTDYNKSTENYNEGKCVIAEYMRVIKEIK